MKKHILDKHKGIISLLLAIVFVLGLSTILSNIAYADGTTEQDVSLSVEYYTQSDTLKNKDGTLFNQKIRDFATNVKSQVSGNLIEHIDKVIPIDYLESTEDNARYQYNGLEYGFYLSKSGNYFDLLLIDFTYGSLNNYEYRMRVSPILQVSFQRTYVAGEYSYFKISDESRSKYFVANPQFLTYIFNENELNYGDAGYSKANDTGMIIRQSRFNYGSMLYKTEEDLIAECAKFGANIVYDTVLKVIDSKA